MAEKHDLHTLGDEAGRYGLSFGDIADILDKYGGAVLSLVVDCLRNGLSFSLVKSILDLFGPLFLRQALNKYKGKQRLSHESQCCDTKECCENLEDDHEEDFTFPEAPIIQGEQVESFDSTIGDLVISILTKILQERGQDIINWIIAMIVKNLGDPAIRAKVVDAVNSELSRR